MWEKIPYWFSFEGPWKVLWGQFKKINGAIFSSLDMKRCHLMTIVYISQIELIIYVQYIFFFTLYLPYFYIFFHIHMLSITHEILSFLQTNTSTSYKISFLFHFLLDIAEKVCIMPQDIPWKKNSLTKLV
jgi:hypothetical protein